MRWAPVAHVLPGEYRLLALAWGLSESRWRVPPRTVAAGVSLQAVLAIVLTHVVPAWGGTPVTLQRLLALPFRPVMGLIKGSVGADFVVPCVDFELDVRAVSSVVHLGSVPKTDQRDYDIAASECFQTGGLGSIDVRPEGCHFYNAVS